MALRGDDMDLDFQTMLNNDRKASITNNKALYNSTLSLRKRISQIALYDEDTAKKFFEEYQSILKREYGDEIINRTVELEDKVSKYENGEGKAKLYEEKCNILLSRIDLLIKNINSYSINEIQDEFSKIRKLYESDLANQPEFSCDYRDLIDNSIYMLKAKIIIMKFKDKNVNLRKEISKDEQLSMVTALNRILAGYDSSDKSVELQDLISQLKFSMLGNEDYIYDHRFWGKLTELVTGEKIDLSQINTDVIDITTPSEHSDELEVVDTLISDYSSAVPVVYEGEKKSIFSIIREKLTSFPAVIAQRVKNMQISSLGGKSKDNIFFPLYPALKKWHFYTLTPDEIKKIDVESLAKMIRDSDEGKIFSGEDGEFKSQKVVYDFFDKDIGPADETPDLTYMSKGKKEVSIGVGEIQGYITINGLTHYFDQDELWKNIIILKNYKNFLTGIMKDSEREQLEEQVENEISNLVFYLESDIFSTSSMDTIFKQLPICSSLVENYKKNQSFCKDTKDWFYEWKENYKAYQDILVKTSGFGPKKSQRCKELLDERHSDKEFTKNWLTILSVSPEFEPKVKGILEDYIFSNFSLETIISQNKKRSAFLYINEGNKDEIIPILQRILEINPGFSYCSKSGRTILDKRYIDALGLEKIATTPTNELNELLMLGDKKFKQRYPAVEGKSVETFEDELRLGVNDNISIDNEDNSGNSQDLVSHDDNVIRK